MTIFVIIKLQSDNGMGPITSLSICNAVADRRQEIILQPNAVTSFNMLSSEKGFLNKYSHTNLCELKSMLTSIREITVRIMENQEKS